MKGIIKDNILIHLSANNLLSSRQHGFVNNRACSTNLLSNQDITTNASLKQIPVDVLYTDFSKVFDKVNHVKLLHKLKILAVCFINGSNLYYQLVIKESSWPDVVKLIEHYVD